jgi:hypothetical protein
MLGILESMLAPQGIRMNGNALMRDYQLSAVSQQLPGMTFTV